LTGQGYVLFYFPRSFASMGRRKFKPYTAEVEIVDAAADGRSVVKHEGQAIFVEGGVPGDVAEIEVFNKRRKVLQGRINHLITPSKHRAEPVCEHFQHCGGCKWQHMTYEAQISFKEKQVRDILHRIGHVEYREFLPILGAPQPYFYRNKLEFSFSVKEWLTPEHMQAETLDRDNRVLGYHAGRVFDKILSIDKCHLHADILNGIRNSVRTYARSQNVPFYDIREHTGLLRTLAFRTSRLLNEVMVILIIAEDRPDVIDQIFSHLEAEYPQITSFVWVHNDKKNSTYSDLPYKIWKGPAYLTEGLGDYKFQIRPVSFFQTNPEQAQHLYEVVKDFLQDTLPGENQPHEVVYDLYSGTGSIGIYLEKFAKKIVGVEYVESAVQDAWENVRLNELEESRFSFYAGNMKDILTPELIAKEGHARLVIADPPRQGMDAKVVHRIIEMGPEYIIYVSCKPATQARDLALLWPHYDLLKVRPVDMFPQTAHVENVVLLKKREQPLISETNA